MVEQVQLKLFNVSHGLSCMIRELPSNYITLIDLGSGSDLSPLQTLAHAELRADQVFISHPHGDHISEIENLYQEQNRPASFFVQDYDWSDVASKEQKHLQDKVWALERVKSAIPDIGYSGGAELKYWMYAPDDAKKFFGESKYIDNSSLAIIYKWKTFKIAVLGDLETDAIDNFCRFQEFSDFAKDTDLLIAAHHGHDCGFPELWVEKIGKPYLTLVSVKEDDPDVCKRYQSPDFAKGVIIKNSTRYMLSTGKDGTIFINMYYLNKHAQWEVNFS